MQRCATLFIFLFLLSVAHGQYKTAPSFRIGASFSFGMSSIAANNLGIGGQVGAEKKISKKFAIDLEMAYSYFTGDKNVYDEGKNNAYAIPLLGGVKYFLAADLYTSLRAGAVYFQFNNSMKPAVQPIIGIAAGMNFPRITNRVNVQTGYNSFRHNEITRGYATLAVSIIID